MVKERFVPKEFGNESFRRFLPAIAALIAVGLPDVARAEAPQPETVGAVEAVSQEASPETRAETQQDIQKQAQDCKAAYDDALNIRKDLQSARPLWIVIDTATGGSQVKDHVQLAHDGFNALQSCFAGSGEHPRITQLIRGDSRETGVSLYPVDGFSLDTLLRGIEDTAEQDAAKLRHSLTLDLTQNNPTLQDFRDVAGGHRGLLETLRKVDSISLGYSAEVAPTGGTIWEFNGQIGFATGDESAVIVRGSGGVETVLTPVEGGRTTVGVAAELSRHHGKIDAAAGAYLFTSLGEHRPDLVVSVLAHPGNGKPGDKLGLQNQMALRFSRDILTREK